MVTEKLPVHHAAAPVMRVRHRDLVSAGSWVVTSFVIFSLANYAFSLALSRVLSVSDYGSFGILSSIFLLEGLVATAGFPWMLSTTMARYRGSEFAERRASALSTALVGNVALGVGSGALVFLLTRHLVHGHPLVPFLAAVASFFVFSNAIWLGLYQGERRFPLLAGLRMGDSITKAVLGVGLAVIGFGLDGAVGGVIAGAASITIWGAARIRGLGRPSTLIDRTLLPTVAWTIAAQLGFGLLMNLDILAVRAVGTGGAAATGAGYYQAASVLARAPVYVALALLNAVFPFLAASAGDVASETRLLRTVLRVIVLVPVPAAVLLVAAPGSAVGVFFPPRYAPAIPLLRINAAAAVSLIVLGVAVMSLQATRGMRTAAVAVLPAVLIEAIALLYAVPRYGAEGAAWSLLAAATLGAVLIWIPGARRWSARSILPSARILVALVGLGLAAFLLRAQGRIWLLEAVFLGSLFLVGVWLLRCVSFAELEPLAPVPVRPLLHWVAERESGGR